MCLRALGWLTVLLLTGVSASSASDNSAKPDAVQAERIKAISAALTWLPPDTETVAVAQDFTFTDPRAGIKPGTPRHQLLGPLIVMPLLGELDNGQLHRHLEARKAQFVLFGGRHFKPVSVFGSLAYEGCWVIVLDNDLPDSGRELIAYMRKRSREVRKIAGREVFVFDTIIVRETGMGVLPDEGTYITLIKPNMLWIATVPKYLEQMLARYPRGGSPRALPADLPEWRHVDMTAPFWIVRHIGPDAPRHFDLGGVREAVGVALSQKKDDPEINVVYFPIGKSAQRYARYIWTANGAYSGARIKLEHNLTYVTLPVLPKEGVGWNAFGLHWTLGADFVLPGDGSPPPALSPVRRADAADTPPPASSDTDGDGEADIRAPDAPQAKRLNAISEALTWLPPDTETVAVAQNFEVPDFSGDTKPKDAASLNARIGPVLALGPSSKVCGGDFWRYLRTRKATFALLGGRKFDIVSAFGSLAYEGVSMLVLEDDLPELGRPLVELLRKHALEVRTIGGREVFKFETEIVRETGIGVLPDEGTYITLVKPNMIWVATVPTYLQESLERYPQGKLPRALPDDLPEWKHVDRTAPYWMVRHVERIAQPDSHPGGTKEALGVAVTMEPAGRKVIEFVYIPTGRDAEKFARPLWTFGSATILSKNNRTYVTVVLPLEKDFFWSMMMLYTSQGSDFVAKAEKRRATKPAASAESKKSFELRFSELESTDPQKTGRSTLVRNAQKLIDDYRGDPCTADAMLFIANLYGLSNPAKNVRRDREESMHWFREAAIAATAGSDPWCFAQFRLAETLREDYANVKNVAEARSVLESVEQKSAGRPLVAARVQKEFVVQCLAEFDYDGAYRHCVKLLSLRDVAQPATERYRFQIPLDQLQMAGAHELLTRLPGSGGTKAERADKIEALRDRFPQVRNIDRSAAVALKLLAQWQDPPAGAESPRPSGLKQPYAGILPFLAIPTERLPEGVRLVKDVRGPFVAATRNPDVLLERKQFGVIPAFFALQKDDELEDVRAAAVAMYEDTRAPGVGNEIGVYALRFLTEQTAIKHLEKLTNAAGGKPLPIFRKGSWLVLVWKDPKARDAALQAMTDYLKKTELSPPTSQK